MSIRNLASLLGPSSIAVVGASDRPATIGSTVWRNLRAGAYAGAVHAVNPSHATLDGQRCYASVDDLPHGIDLAIVCTPAPSVVQVVASLAAIGCRACIVMSAGLTSAQKAAMLASARPALLRILGPNCLGLLSAHIGLNASFAHTDALPGDVAFVSQSGALVTAVLDWAKSRGIGFSHLISLGEHADVDFGDLLDFLASDPHTRSILLYIESIEAARKFMSAARAAARNKPVIVVKAGRAGRGPAAAASHTGAMTGSDDVFDAAIRRAGMLRVDTLEELFAAAETLARFGRNADSVMTLMTNGGGAGVLAADAAAREDVTLATLPPALLEALDRVLPEQWSHANPIDMIGDAPIERYVHVLDALLKERASGAVLFMHAPTAIVRSDDIARACAPLVRAAPGRVMSCWLGGGSVAEARHVLEEAGAADYETPEEAVRAFAWLSTYRRNQALLSEVPSASELRAPDAAQARDLIACALRDGSEWLSDEAARELLALYGVPVLQAAVVEATPDAVGAAAARLGYPVALKIRSPQIVHKSDVGGVALELHDEAALRTAVATMLTTARERLPHAQVSGFTVQQMARRPHALELIVGAAIDPVFGPVVLFGHGGTAVEVLADRAMALPPLNRTLARDLVARTRVARLLGGYRDRPAARMDAVYDVLIAISQLIADHAQIVELDINPLWADEQGALALDARVRLRAASEAGGARLAIAPYPAELAESLVWRGIACEFRPIKPEDGPVHQRFVESISPEDLRLRFFSTRRQLAPSELARLTQIDYMREMAFVVLGELPGAKEGERAILGVVRSAIDPDNVEAEFAVTVRTDMKGSGLGTLLMQRLIAYQRTRGTTRLVGHVLRENKAMRRLAASLGFVAHDDEDPTAVRYVLTLEAASGEAPRPPHAP